MTFILGDPEGFGARERREELEGLLADAIKTLQMVYLADDEGSSAFIEIQDKVANALFNLMGWSGQDNNFSTWQEEQLDKHI